MADPARIHDEPLASAPKPLLQVVRDTIAHPTPEDAMPNIGHTAMIGCLVGFLVVAGVITVSGTLAGIGFGASLALGAFVGMWGGAGFGFMMGSTLPLARYLDAQSAHSTHHGQGEIHGTAAR